MTEEEKRVKINKVKFMGVMIFITILLDVIPSSGFVEYGNISLTTMHIPTIITAIVLGPGWGAIIGAIFGLVSLLHAISREATPMDLLFINPLVSVLPRICIALVSGGVYYFLSKLTTKKFQPAAVLAAAICGTMTNSFLVLLALCKIWPNQLMDIFSLSGREQLVQTMTENVRTNMLIEICAAMVITILAVTLTKKISERNMQKYTELHQLGL